MKSTSKTSNRYAELGKAVAGIYETGYLDTNKSLKMSFFKGLVQGLGGVIGATLGIALLLWVLTFFSELPLVGRIFEAAQHTIEQP